MAMIQPNSGVVFRRERILQPGEPAQITYLVIQGISDLDRANSYLLSGAADNLGAGQATYTALHNTYTDGQFNTDLLPGGQMTVNVSVPNSSTFSDSYVNTTAASVANAATGNTNVDTGPAGTGTGTGTGNNQGGQMSVADANQDINTGFMPEALGDRDWESAYRAALGTATRPMSDPYRQYQERNMWDFFRPYQYQNVLDATTSGTTAPGFQQYLANIGGSLATARQNAANVFNQLVGGGGGADIQNLLGATAAAQSPWGELTDPLRTTLAEIAQLGQQGMRGRLGSAAYNVLGRFAPSAEDVYRDYFQRSRAGMDVAPTFGQALQAAYGLG